MSDNKILASLCLCNFGGIVILDIDGDKITSAFDFGDGIKNKRTTRTHYDKDGNAYITRYKTKYYLYDFMRV